MRLCLIGFCFLQLTCLDVTICKSTLEEIRKKYVCYLINSLFFLVLSGIVNVWWHQNMPEMLNVHFYENYQHRNYLATNFLYERSCLWYRSGLIDDVGFEALMMEALEQVEKNIKKPFLRSDKKNMALIFAVFDKINKKVCNYVHLHLNCVNFVSVARYIIDSFI